MKGRSLSSFLVVLILSLAFISASAQQLRRAEWAAPSGELRFHSSQNTSLKSDTVPSKWSVKWNMEHSPLKATVLAATLPGAGQIYNKKYWKLPILYAGLGTCVYFIADNTKEYRKWRDSFIAANDGDAGTVPEMSPLVYNLDANQETWRKYTEISYMALIGVYVLQIIDANVDAHLFYFDVSPDVGLHVHPSLINTGQLKAGIGISLRL